MGSIFGATREKHALEPPQISLNEKNKVKRKYIQPINTGSRNNLNLKGQSNVNKRAITSILSK